MSAPTTSRFDARVTRGTAGGIFAAAGVLVALLGLIILKPLGELANSPPEGIQSAPAIVEVLVGLGIATAGMYALVKLDLSSVFTFNLRRLAHAGVAGVVIFFVGGYCALFFMALLPADYMLVAQLLGFGLAVVLYVRPKWYVVNTVALCLAPVFVAVLGRKFAVGPMLLLLAVLVAYDIFAVYVTGHMVELAEGVLEWDITLPILISVPLTADAAAESERPKAHLGVGDLVIPAAIVTSAALWSPAPPVIGAANLPALVAVGGIAVGHLAMHVLPDHSTPHAGLPFLNTGAIAGYVGGSLAAGLSLATALGIQTGVLGVLSL